MPNSGAHQVVEGIPIDVEAGQHEGLRLLHGEDEGGDELRHRGSLHGGRRRNSVCADDDAAHDIMHKGTPGKTKGLRDSIVSLRKSMTKDDGDDIVHVKQEEPEPEPWYVLFAVPIVIGGYLLGDAGKLLFEKPGTSNVHSGSFAICCSFTSLLAACILVPVLVGPSEGLKQAFDWNTMKNYIPPTIFFATGQLFNIIQNQFMEPSQRKVFAQLRIPLTAFLSRFIMGHGFSTVQWTCIFAITVAVFEFELLAKDGGLFGGKDSGNLMIGLLFCIVQNILASLGSLIGEKTMKEGKKQPFVVQKFQFAIWEFIFISLVAMLIISPTTHGIIDAVKGSEEFPLFHGAMPVWPGIRVAYYTYNTGYLTNIPFEAKYATVGNNNKEEQPMHKIILDNKFDTDGWARTADSRKIFAHHSDFDTDHPQENYKYSSVLALLEKKIQKEHKLKSLNEKAIKACADDTIEEMQYVECDSPKGCCGCGGGKADEPTKYNFGILDHRKQFMHDLVEETTQKKMLQGNPFGVVTKVEPGFVLSEYFTMMIGLKSDDKKQPFTSLALQARHQPNEIADVLKRLPFNSGDKLNTEYVSNPDKITGAGKPAEYFKMTTDVPLTVGTVGKYKRIAQDAKVEGNKVAGAFVDALEELHKSSGAMEGKDEAISTASVNAGVQEQVRAAILSALLEDARITDKGMTYTYKKAIRYLGHSDKIEIVYIRNESRVLQMKKHIDDPNDRKKSFTMSSEKKLKLTFAIEGEKKLHFEENPFEATKNMAKLVSVEREAASDPKAEFSQDKEFGKVLEAERNKYRENNVEAGKSAEEKADFAAKSDEEKQTQVDEAHAKIFNLKTPSSPGNDGLYERDDVLDGTNETPKFKISRAEFATKFKGSDSFDFVVWTYPGRIAAGVQGKGGSTGCVLGMCNLNNAEWNSNFAYYNWIFKYFASFVRPPYKASDAPDYEEYIANPFGWAEVHGYTRNPLPGVFLADPWFWVALFCNVMQNWFSTLLSKTLSSLWKNIFAAVALACVIVFEKFLLKDQVDFQDTKWDRVILAMLGVLVSVMLFNLIPKEKH